MNDKVFVAGVGMTRFHKPGAGPDYVALGQQAVRTALSDAGLEYAQVQQAYAGYVYGDSTCGQRVLYGIGMSGIPIVNVNNNCSTGSAALYLARQAVASGAADCVLAVGFEQMKPGALDVMFDDRPNVFQQFKDSADALLGESSIPLALRYFGGAGLSHMRKYGTPLQAFAKIRAKASRHAVNNPLALFNKEISVDEVMESPALWPGVMTRLMACPPTCGAAAALLVSAAFARQHGLRSDVAILAQALATDRADTFAAHDMMHLVGYGMTQQCARQVYAAAGIGADDVDVIELHDCFAQNELISYEALGLCAPGEAARFIDDGDNTYGGRYVVNPSGGLLSKGHPLGATGLAQCYELTQQLRGTADRRQVPGARIGLQHNLGLGGACVVSLYQAL